MDGGPPKNCIPRHWWSSEYKHNKHISACLAFLQLIQKNRSCREHGHKHTWRRVSVRNMSTKQGID